MSETQKLFDRKLVAHRRARVSSRVREYTFLLDRVALDFCDRLSGIKRTFPVGVNLGAYNGALSRKVRTCETVGTLIDVELSFEMATLCDGPRVVADEEMLPFANGELDMVLSGLSLQLVNDLPGALVQVFRALKSDGLFMASLLGGETLCELREAWLVAEDEVRGGASPRVAPLASLQDMGSLLQRAGFSLPVVDRDRVEVTYPSAMALMQDIKSMGASNVLSSRSGVPVSRGLLKRVCQVYQDRFGADDGRVRATFEILTATAWVPHSSQQQPLKPGSATSRLADALGVREVSTGEKAER